MEIYVNRVTMDISIPRNKLQQSVRVLQLFYNVVAEILGFQLGGHTAFLLSYDRCTMHYCAFHVYGCT